MIGIKAQETLLGNFDRHNGNWGFLYDDSIKEASLAPIYDCGSFLKIPFAKQYGSEEVINSDTWNKISGEMTRKY